MSQPGRGKKLTFGPKNNRDILLSTIFLSISYAPSPFGFFAFFAFIPLLRMIFRCRPQEAFWCAYVVGILSNMLLLHWVAVYNFWYYLVLVPLNALQFAFFGLIFGILAQRQRIMTLILFPFVWTTLEFVREWGAIGFTWLNIGHTQSAFLALIQFAEFTGVLGLVFWICLINVVLILWWDYRRSLKHLASFSLSLLLLFLAPATHGVSVLSGSHEAPGLVVSYVQPNIRNVLKWSPEFRDKNLWLLLTESQKFRGYSPDLIVWPETALPLDLKKEQQTLALLRTWVEENDQQVLLGTLDSDGIHRYNAATLIKTIGSNLTEIYRKIRPVPVAERRIFTESRDTTKIDPGSEYTTFRFNTQVKTMTYTKKMWRINSRSAEQTEVICAALICFESAFPALASEMSKQGAQLIAIITNDESFGYSAQPYQHLQIARMRAIETRRSVVQCANTGISAFIDPHGNIFKQSVLFENRLAIQNMPLNSHLSFFTRYRDLMGWIYPGISTLLIFYILIRNGKMKKV